MASSSTPASDPAKPHHLPPGVTTECYTTAALRAQPSFLLALQTLITEAYRHIHGTSDLIPQWHERVKAPEQICNELGPDGLLLVAFGDEDETNSARDAGAESPQSRRVPVACAGVKPLQQIYRQVLAEKFYSVKHPGITTNGASQASTSGLTMPTPAPSGTSTPAAATTGMAEPAPADSVPSPSPSANFDHDQHDPATQWEICFICVLPRSKYAGVGLPGTLLRMIEEETLRRVSLASGAAAAARRGDGEPNSIRRPPSQKVDVTFVIRICEPLTGKWWARNKSYTFFWDEIVPKGMWDARYDFVVRWGAKVVGV